MASPDSWVRPPVISDDLFPQPLPLCHRLCENPVVLTLDDLRKTFKVVTIPITLVCAGNRRKEQNVVRKSLGFSWGGAGLSTALFTGVWLADVIEYVRPMKSTKHVIFEGCDQLPNGPYGTRQVFPCSPQFLHLMVLTSRQSIVELG